MATFFPLFSLKFNRKKGDSFHTSAKQENNKNKRCGTSQRFPNMPLLATSFWPQQKTTRLACLRVMCHLTTYKK